MALQVCAAGFTVTGVDPFDKQRAAEAGLAAEAQPDSAATADTVIVMVATPDQLRAVALGETGLVARMQPGASLIVMSTVGPEPVQEVGNACAEKGVHLLDVPVTGGVARAKTGELNLFTSGSPEAVQTNTWVLEAMGRIIDCGEEIGMGQAYKAVNQLLCSVHIVAAAEALAFGEKLGLDPAKVLPVVESGAGGSWMLARWPG